MRVCAFIDNTTLDATKAMIDAIDYSDFSVMNIVVVPDRFSLQMEKLLLSTFKNKALFNVKVMGLTSLATYIFDKLGKKIEVLSSGQCLLLTQKAINNVKGQFTTFRKSGINFCFEINKIISQLKSSGVSYDELNEKAEGLSGGKYHDIKLIYEEYQKLIQGKFDANERLSLLISDIENSDILSDTNFYFAQFDSFTAEGYNLIKTLIKVARSVSVSLASARSIGNDYIYEKDILQKLTTLSKELGATIETSYHKSTFSPEKEAVVCGLYSYQQRPAIKSGFYSVYSSQNIYEELSSCAKLIHYLVQKGYRYKDIAVACDLKHQDKIENIFEKFDLPCFIDSAVTADQTLLARCVLGFLDTINLSYSNASLQSLATNSLLDVGSENIELIQKYNIDSKYKYKKYLSKVFAYDNVLKALEKCKTAQDYKEVLISLLDKIKENFNKILLRLEEKSYIKERDINRQSEEIILENLSLIASEYQGEIELGEYIRTLKLLLSFKEVSSVPTQADGVMVGDASASYYGDCKVLVVLGCEELPLQSSDSGLLNDYDLSMNFIDKKIEPTIRMINRRNRFKLFNLLTLPSERLFCFTKLYNEEGKKTEIPVFIDSLNKIFGQKVIRSQSVFSGGGAGNLLIKLGNRANFIEEYYKLLSQDNIDKLGISGQLPAPRQGQYLQEGELFFKNNRISVTELETYFSCPLKHFVRYGLKLKEKETCEFDARDTGNICHRGAELFVKEIMAKGKDNLSVNEFIDKNFDNILAELELTDKLDSASEKKSLVAFFKHQLFTVLSDILKEINLSSFVPTEVEKKLDGITIDGVSLLGKIDRIDECGDYFRIIDYKSGRTGNILKQLYYGEKLQLFLYQRIVKNNLSKIPAGVFYFNARLDYLKSSEEKVLLNGLASANDEVLELLDKDIESRSSPIVSLYKSKKGEFKGSVIAKESLGVYEDYAYSVAKQGIAEIKEGYIEPKPNENSCDHCQFASICLYEKLGGVRGDLKVGEFKEILKDEANR